MISIANKANNMTKGLDRNAYLNDKDSNNSANENDKMIHISALPEEMNYENGFTSPFNNALNKYMNSKNNNFAIVNQEANYYQPSTESKTQDKFSDAKKSKWHILYLLCFCIPLYWFILVTLFIIRVKFEIIGIYISFSCP